jgi:sarcosine oxidase
MTRTWDIAVIGAGVFGAWIAHDLRQAGNSVLLVDQYGPGSSRASSGGETRIIRMSYGADELYAGWSIRSLELWKAFIAQVKLPLFHRTGVLWLADERDAYTAAGLDMLQRLAVPVERMSRGELETRYPQIALHDITWGFLEPESGALMARQAVQAVVNDARRDGVEYLQAAVGPPVRGSRLQELQTTAGQKISAATFVFACGPWLPKLFPDLLSDRLFITRQEVFFFGVPAGDLRFSPPQMPIWLCHSDDVYGFPDLDSRGFKTSFDRHGPPFDPDSGDRVVSVESAKVMRDYVARRFPALKDAPIVEARVCQYENTSNGDFLIDRHPAWGNVWLVGGGSGHGFKHGPALGEYVAQQLAGAGQAEARFSLSAKQAVQRRTVY